MRKTRGWTRSDLTLTLADIHAYFESLVQVREIAEAREILDRGA